MFEGPAGKGGAEGTTSSPVSISARTRVWVQSLWLLDGCGGEMSRLAPGLPLPLHTPGLAHLSRGGLAEPGFGGGAQGGGRTDEDM